MNTEATLTGQGMIKKNFFYPPLKRERIILSTPGKVPGALYGDITLDMK